MTIEQFWSIVEDVHQRSGGDMDTKCDLLDQRLRQLTADEVLSFDQHFDELNDRAYSWELWAAAYIIGGGCSDDSFSDFRSTLISMGREFYEKTLTDPQHLADVDYDPDVADYEGYQYVPTTVYGDMTGGQLPRRLHPLPAQPSGKPWDEDKVAEIHPKLAKHYDY